jgi:hypothetical protein
VHSAQALLLKVGVLGHVIPLLFGYDVTHDAGEDAAATDLDASVSRRGPGFLGLSIERSNMQVPQAQLNLCTSPSATAVCDSCILLQCFGSVDRIF